MQGMQVWSLVRKQRSHMPWVNQAGTWQQPARQMTTKTQGSQINPHFKKERYAMNIIHS